MNEVIGKQLEDILNNHRSERTGQTFAEGTKLAYKATFENLLKALGEMNPGRRISCMADITSEDLKAYQIWIGHQKNKLNGTPLKSGSVTGAMMNIKGIFKAAHNFKMISEDITKELKVRWYKDDVEGGLRMSPEEVGKLCVIDEERLKQLDTRARMIYLRNLAMLRVHKDAALRLGEVVRLCEEDVQWGRKSQGGIVPLRIQEGKCRAANQSDIVYLTSWAWSFLKRYLDAKAEFCAANNIASAQVCGKRNREPQGRALFIGQCGQPLGEFGYMEIFKRGLSSAGLDTKYTTHDLRHTRICEWVDSGINPRKVQKLARHKDLKLTLEVYYHFNEKELVDNLDKLYGDKRTAAGTSVPSELLPIPEVRKFLFRHALQNAPQSWDETMLDHLDALLIGESGPDKLKDLYYSTCETYMRLKLSRTQLHEWVKRGYIRKYELDGKPVFLKKDVEELTQLRSTEEASIILGYREPHPVTMCKLAREGIVPSLRVGNGYRFRDKDLADFLKDKHSGRLRVLAISHRRMDVNPNIPQARQEYLGNAATEGLAN